MYRIQNGEGTKVYLRWQFGSYPVLELSPRGQRMRSAKIELNDELIRAIRIGSACKKPNNMP